MTDKEKESEADKLNKSIHEVMAGLKESYSNWLEYQNMMDKLTWVSKELNSIRTSEIKGDIDEHKEIT